MSAINADWNSRNALRAHPLDDAATAVDDSGEPLPPDILVDCSIRFPVELGITLFLAGVSTSRTGTTLVFQASRRIATPSLLDVAVSDGPFQPIATISVSGRVPEGRAIPVNPAAPGVSGWVTLGPGAGVRTYSGRFSTLEQGAILPGRARPRMSPGVRSLGTLVERLDGLVLLSANPDAVVETEDVEVAGESVTAVFVGFRDDRGGEVLAKYVGPCGGRPESGTCDPPGVERINEVEPDSDGDLRIRFDGVDDYPLVGRTGGLVLDVPATLDDVCPPKARLGLDPDTGAPERPEGVDSPDFVDFREDGLDSMRLGSGLFSVGPDGVSSRDPDNANLAIKDRGRPPKRIIAVLVLPEIGGDAGIAFNYSESDGPAFAWARVSVKLDGSVRLELASVSASGESVAASSPNLWEPGPPGPPTLGRTTVELAVSLGEVREGGWVRATVEVSSVAFSGWIAGNIAMPTPSATHGIAATGASATFETLEAIDDVG